VIVQAGYPSVAAAVAEHTVFLHPETVMQTRGSALFPVVRSMARRGQIDVHGDGRRVLFDDNLSPTNAFVWAGRISRGRDVQFNHIWTASDNRDAYTALWNLCATPAFLAKTTDGSNHPEVTAALRFRAYSLYGALPEGEPAPPEPESYDHPRWAPHPEPWKTWSACSASGCARAPRAAALGQVLLRERDRVRWWHASYRSPCRLGRRR
jgi:hypothetical protein